METGKRPKGDGRGGRGKGVGNDSGKKQGRKRAGEDS